MPERLVKGLRVRAPTSELVESYLQEIAKAYGVDWPYPGMDDHDGDIGKGDDDDDDDDDDGGIKDKDQHQTELSKATPPSELGKNPVSVSAPGARTDNLHPQVKLPPSNKTDDESDRIPEVDELAKRFAALRRR